MPKCPRCCKDIDHLTVIETRNYTAKFTARGYDCDTISLEEMVDRIWTCPECNDQLFDSVREALGFFGEESLKFFGFEKEVQNGES